jgi:8-oxo-dGTP pyrophosphatase MutT (NUDIX family)
MTEIATERQPREGAEIVARIRQRLLATEPQPAPGLAPDWVPDTPFDRPPVPAAVLIALVERQGAVSVLYTERSPTLRAHSGQIAFPGGKIDPTDISAADAALREAGEEVGLRRDDAEVLGFLPVYQTGTNYLITPVVARIAPSAPFIPNPDEVRSVFEVPLDFLMAPNSFIQHRISRNGRDHSSWRIDHSGLVIWGITANLTRIFHDLALAAEQNWPN